MDDTTNPFTDSLSSGLSEAWGSLGDAYHKTGDIATDAYEVAHHTAAAMGDAFLGDTAGVDHHMERRHAYERAIGDDYKGLRRIVGLSVPEDNQDPSQSDSSDSSGNDGTGEDGGSDAPGDATDTMDYYGGDNGDDTADSTGDGSYPAGDSYDYSSDGGDDTGDGGSDSYGTADMGDDSAGDDGGEGE